MKYRISEVAEMTGVAVHRIEYAVRRQQIEIARPTRRWARHWFTAEEVRAVCRWFGVPEPHLQDDPNTNMNITRITTTP